MGNLNAKSNVLVVGTGGVGGYFGGQLAAFGYNVTFLARGEHYQTIKNKGLVIKSIAGDFAVNTAKVVERLEDAPTPELVLFCVKTYSTAELAPQLAKIINSQTIVISIQNGLGNDDEIATYIPREQVFPGLAQIISTKTAPGVISHTAGPRSVIFGDAQNPSNDKLLAIQTYMRDAGVDATASRNIMRDIWHKFIFIASFGGMTAMYGCPIGKILEDSERYQRYKKSVQESVAVAMAYNIPIDANIYEKTIERTETYRGAQGGAKSSLLKDVEARSKTEIDSLSGMVVKMGQAKQIQTPIHKIIVEKIRQ